MDAEHSEVKAFLNWDADRPRRRGYPEAVFCEGKTLRQLRLIAGAVSKEACTIFTRVKGAQADVVREVLPDAFYDADARFLAWPPRLPDPAGGTVAIVCAGTADLPVAREAELTLNYFGRKTAMIVDVGVAGLHRILSKIDLIRDASVVVVAAGMDGALPSVVAGLVEAPVIALPTSVGYGASFRGVAALLSMLNSCSPGVAVVNIDNGYGAAHLAAQILRVGGRHARQ